MKKIIDNATFKTWVLSQKTSRDDTLYKIAKVTGLSLGHLSNTMYNRPLTARNASLIQAAIERGEL